MIIHKTQFASYLFGLAMVGVMVFVGCDKTMPEKEQDEIVQQEDGENWWNVPFSRMSLFENEDESYLSFEIGLDKPEQGSMSDEKYRALLDFVGGAVIKGAESLHFVSGVVTKCAGPYATVDTSVEAVRTWFWKNPDAQEKICRLQISGEIKYCGEQYFSYAVQYGSWDWGDVSASVWSWKKMRIMKITDFIDIDKHKAALKRLMRKAVYEEFKEPYAGEMELVLPEKYAKNWPHTFENFYVNEQGIVWCFDSGEVLIGGRCPMEIVVGWNDLKGLLRDKSLIPARVTK